MAKRNTFFEDEKLEKKIDIKQLGKTLKYILPFKKILFLISAMLLIASVASLLPPRLLRLIVDETVVNKDYKQLVLVCAGLAVLAGAVFLGLKQLYSYAAGVLLLNYFIGITAALIWGKKHEK